MKTYIRKHPLVSFVLINYMISWIFIYPSFQLILNAEEGTFPLLASIGIIGVFGPSIAAIIVKKITHGNSGVKRLLKKLLIWKVQLKWYLFIFLIPIVLYALSVMSTALFGYQFEEINFKEGIVSIVPLLLIALPFGPLGEELGWRGFFLPKLLEKYTIWKSSLILGIVWTVWHLASFTLPGVTIPSVFEVSLWTLFLYLLMTIAEALLYTYVFLKTRGSVFIAIILHTVFNASSNIILTIFPQVENNVDQRELIYITNLLLVIIVSVFLLRKNKAT